LPEPGIRLGRTDPKLDPKGAFTVELLRRAEEFQEFRLGQYVTQLAPLGPRKAFAPPFGIYIAI
jgi:hypothetical protein